ncbi:glycine betaine ABC transporter substrate-binding protein [Petrotoga sp. DB-2]
MEKKMAFVLLAVLLFSSVLSAAEKGEIEIAYVQWASAEAQTHISKILLEEMGYDVTIRAVSAAVMWTGLANEDVDLSVCAWLPYTHEGYWEKYSEDVVDLGPVYEGARIGLVVPTYVSIDSIEELAEHKEEFGERIVGIEPGAGIMIHTREDAMPAYRLEDWNLVSSSDPAMMAELERAVQREEWIVITGWTPHWMWFAYDLKFLEDPKNAYGEEENIRAIGRKGFREDFPEVAEFIENFKMNDDQLGEVTYDINVNRTNPEQAAKKWIEENRDVVEKWLP